MIFKDIVHLLGEEWCLGFSFLPESWDLGVMVLPEGCGLIPTTWRMSSHDGRIRVFSIFGVMGPLPNGLYKFMAYKMGGVILTHYLRYLGADPPSTPPIVSGSPRLLLGREPTPVGSNKGLWLFGSTKNCQKLPEHLPNPAPLIRGKHLNP